MIFNVFDSSVLLPQKQISVNYNSVKLVRPASLKEAKKKWNQSYLHKAHDFVLQLCSLCAVTIHPLASFPTEVLVR